MGGSAHWENVYRTTVPDQVSWFQAEARLSLELIERFAPDRGSHVVDVGAGASRLVDGLLASGYRNLTVVDLSAVPLASARERIGNAAGDVTWLAADVLTASFAAGAFDVWRDRAVFHFLTDAEDRRRYAAQARNAVRPGGHVIIATFAADGPTRCSGLDVIRYSPQDLHAELGAGFEIVETHREVHRTPGGVEQPFTYGVFRVEPGAGVTLE